MNFSPIWILAKYSISLFKECRVHRLWPAIVYTTNSPSSYVENDGNSRKFFNQEKRTDNLAIDQIHIVNDATHSKTIETCLGIQKTFEPEDNLKILLVLHYKGTK